MGKFLKYFLFFLIPLSTFGVVLEMMIREIPNDYAYKKFYLDKNADKIEALILGSSHAFADINPTYLTIKGFNAAYNSQTLKYDFKIVNKYRNQLTGLKFIILPISYFTLNAKLETSIESWRIKNYMVYYGMNSSFKITDYSELLSNNSTINIERLKSHYLLHKKYITCSLLGWGTTHIPKPDLDLEEAGKKAAKRHTHADSAAFYQNLDYLTSIIAFAKERNIKVFLFTPPAYKSYVNNLDKRQLNGTVAKAKEFASKNKNVFYTSFLTDTSFVSSDYFDSDHLNPKGAKKFTEKLNSTLQSLSK